MEDKLIKFVGLVDAGSFTLAASKLNISQPALTMSIKQLEKQLGSTLIKRGGKRFVVTKAGQEAYLTGRKIIYTKRQLLNSLKNLQADHNLRLGMIDSVAEAIFSNDIVSTKLLNLTGLELTINSTANLLNDLAQDKLDYVIAVETTFNAKSLIGASHIFNESMKCVASPKIYDEAVKSLKQKSTLNSYISYNKESNTKRLISAQLKKHNVKSKTVAYSTSPELMKKLALNGKGLAILPSTSVAKDVEEGSLKVINSPKLNIQRSITEYQLIYKKQPEITKILKESLLK
jgi:LysR family transcriptional regulator, transcriptional activator of the cysJI operon